MLVVDDHARARESMADMLRHAGHKCSAALRRRGPGTCCNDGKLRLRDHRSANAGHEGAGIHPRSCEQRPHGAQILMVTAHATVASAVEAMRHGAFDYIEKPFDADQLEQLVARALEHGRLLDQRSPVRSCRPAADGDDRLEPADAVAADADRPGRPRPRETVLITGESGTGKELVARWLHARQRSPASRRW